VRRDRHARYFVEHGRTSPRDYSAQPDRLGQAAPGRARELPSYDGPRPHTQDVDLAVGLLVNAAFAFQAVRYVLRIPAAPVLALPGASEHPGSPVH
jgi:hypothetical protein